MATGDAFEDPTASAAFVEALGPVRDLSPGIREIIALPGGYKILRTLIELVPLIDSADKATNAAREARAGGEPALVETHTAALAQEVAAVMTHVARQSILASDPGATQRTVDGFIEAVRDDLGRLGEAYAEAFSVSGLLDRHAGRQVSDEGDSLGGLSGI